MEGDGSDAACLAIVGGALTAAAVNCNGGDPFFFSFDAMLL